MKIGPADYVLVPELDAVDPKPPRPGGLAAGDRTYKRQIGGKTTGTVRIVVKMTEDAARFHVEVRGDIPRREVEALSRSIELTVRDLGGAPAASGWKWTRVEQGRN